MNKRKTENPRKKKYNSSVVRSLLVEYFFTLFVCGIGVLLFIYLMWQICSAIVWQPNDMIYIALEFVRSYIIAFVGGIFLIIWLVVTAYYMEKPLHYLDEIVEAAGTLSHPNSQPIELSPALSHTENQLNHVREEALENARIAKEAEQRKNDLVVYLAHDLKTPLTSVIGYLTLLHDEGQISEELREKYLSIALDKAEHLEDLINEFFEITRFNLSNISLEYSRINLTRMLEQITYEFKPMFLEKNLSCQLDADPDIMIRCDINKMQRVFDNLLRNAVNYSFEDSKIQITARRSEDKVDISFFNHGNTIPEEKLERIFEQFYRLDTARSSRSGGAGLGLAIAKEIVELHGGQIQAKSYDDTVRFEVSLPLS